MCGGFFHHFSADILTAGEKDVIKMFFQQAGVFRTSTGDNCNHLRRKTFPDHFFNQLTGIRMNKHLVSESRCFRQQLRQSVDQERAGTDNSMDS